MQFLNYVSNLLYRASSIPVALIVTLIYIGFMVSVMPQQSIESSTYAGAWGAPDRHFFYTPDQLYAEISGWSQEGRSHYINFRLGLDIIWALAYTGFLCSWISILLSAGGLPVSHSKLFNAFPLATLVCDYGENFLGIVLVANATNRMDTLAWAATLLTSMKWLTLVVAHLILIWAGLRAWQARNR
ncbi:MAG: hypothetical protein ACR2QG_09955 [Gammaproteobacteria bacterium]